MLKTHLSFRTQRQILSNYTKSPINFTLILSTEESEK